MKKNPKGSNVQPGKVVKTIDIGADEDYSTIVKTIPEKETKVLDRYYFTKDIGDLTIKCTELDWDENGDISFPEDERIPMYLMCVVERQNGNEGWMIFRTTGTIASCCDEVVTFCNQRLMNLKSEQRNMKGLMDFCTKSMFGYGQLSKSSKKFEKERRDASKSDMEKLIKRRNGESEDPADIIDMSLL